MFLHFITKSRKANEKPYIPLVTHLGEERESGNDNDYDDYNTRNTSKVSETTFIKPGSSGKQTASNLQLKQKSKTR